MSESQMKVLVYWTEESQWSVVSQHALRDTTASPGTSTHTKFGGKWYPSVVIAKNYQKETLKHEEKCFKDFINDTLSEEAPQDMEKKVKEYVIAKGQSTDKDRRKQTTVKRKFASELMKIAEIESDADTEIDSDQSESLLLPPLKKIKTTKKVKQKKAKMSREIEASRSQANKENSLMLLEDPENPVLERMLKMEKNIETIMANQQQLFNCRNCLKTLYKDLSSEKTPNKPSEKTPNKPSEKTPNKPKQNAVAVAETTSSTPSDKQIEELQDDMSRDPPVSPLSQPVQSANESVSIDDLSYMGSAQFGVRVPAERLKNIEKTSANATKLALGLIELLITKEQCVNLSIYGLSKDKVPLDPNKRKALRSHVFHLYPSEEGNWEGIVIKLNDKIRAIKNNKYRLK